MTEIKKGACKPRYKREFSIFEDETIEKLKDFRAARSNWITSNANKTINIGSEEDFYKSNDYKGRWAFLRKKWFITFLHLHYKTLRPLRYYTLKQKLSRPSLSELEQMRLRTKTQEKSICKALKKIEVKTPEEKLQLEKCKKKKKAKKRRIGSDEFFMRILCPSKKAIKRLKAAKLENRMIESCRCDDGKELTVVIKGVCLCDKTSLNKFKLNKVCNEYTKFENKNAQELSKPIFPHATDSLEVIKKRMSRYSLAKEGDQGEEEITELESITKKKIKFANQTSEKGNKVKANKHRKCLSKLNQTMTKPERMTSAQLEETENQEAEINKSVLKEKAQRNKTNLTESNSERYLRCKDSKSNINLEERLITRGGSESTLTLYKNRPQEQSHIGLTEEQREKMKKSGTN